MGFDYQKAYCVQAVPAFQSLPEHVRGALGALAPLVADLAQNKAFNIPLSPEIEAIFAPISIQEIAEVSRAIYFLGHWHPSLLPRLFPAAKGETWKISNCADQILRARLAPLPSNIQIHEGKFRVTFSNLDCWLWREFGLATEENLETFKTCGLPFNETTIDDSARALAEQIDDLWPSVDTMPENDLYRQWQQLNRARIDVEIKANFEREIKSLEQAKVNAQTKIDFLRECNGRGVSIDNVIYYPHTGAFCFGWRTLLSQAEKEEILTRLGDMPERYKIEFKIK